MAYLRFKNLTIGYTLPVLKKYLSKLRIYVSGENLCYWSPLKKHCKLIDPELAISSGTYKGGTGNGLHHAPHLLVRRRHHLLTTSSRKEYENHL